MKCECGMEYKTEYNDTCPRCGAAPASQSELIKALYTERATMKSPALTHQSEHYPSSWKGLVPKRVKLVKDVTPDMPFLAKQGTFGLDGEEFDCWVNSHGAVAIICDNGERLGVKPYEFEVVEWHAFRGSEAV